MAFTMRFRRSSSLMRTTGSFLPLGVSHVSWLPLCRRSRHPSLERARRTWRVLTTPLNLHMPLLRRVGWVCWAESTLGAPEGGGNRHGAVVLS